MAELKMSDTVVHKDKPRKERRKGTLYLKYTYILKCPVIVLLLSFMALSYGALAIMMLLAKSWMGLLLLLIPITFGAEAVIALVTVFMFYRCERKRAYTPALYRMTQALIWGGCLAWWVIMGVYIIAMSQGTYYSAGSLLCSISLMIIVLSTPPLLRSLYFRRRKAMYYGGNERANEEKVTKKDETEIGTI